MKDYLANPDAAFYHVSALENMANIKEHGLIADSGKIFVCTESKNYLLACIAYEQIPEIYDSKGFVVVKLTQSKNQFVFSELYHDNQVLNETARVFQFIICRSRIPPENLEIADFIEFGNEGPDMLRRLAGPAYELKDTDEIVQQAANIEANRFDEPDVDDYFKQ